MEKTLNLIEKMSIRPTERKESAFSAVEAPPSDLELKIKQAKGIYYYMLMFLGIDYLLSVLIITNESNFFSDDDNEYTLFIIKIICLTAFFLFFLISLYFFILRLTKIIKYIYIFFAFIYYLFELFLNIKDLVEDFSDTDWADVVFFLCALFTIIPRLFFFYNIDLLIIKILEIDDCKRGEEHDNFRENLENKMERGEDTNWSKTSLPTEKRQTSQFLSGNTIGKPNKFNTENVIKENYEEEDNNEKDENNIDNENNV